MKNSAAKKENNTQTETQQAKKLLCRPEPLGCWWPGSGPFFSRVVRNRFAESQKQRQACFSFSQSPVPGRLNTLEGSRELAPKLLLCKFCKPSAWCRKPTATNTRSEQRKCAI
eukprot:g50137.t1